MTDALRLLLRFCDALFIARDVKGAVACLAPGALERCDREIGACLFAADADPSCTVTYTEERDALLAPNVSEASLQMTLTADGCVSTRFLSCVATGEGGAARIHTLHMPCVPDRLKDEERIRRALESVRRANDDKRRLLSCVSHELRTPMNAIIGLSALAVEDAQSLSEARDALSKINGAGKKMLARINNILETDDASGDDGQADCTLCNLTGRRILIADDQPLNIEVVRRILKKAGAEATAAANGLEAVELFKASRVFYFDAVLMDIQMPIMDGLNAARSIRGLKRADSASVPIIALTANGFCEDIEQSLAFGMDAHLLKPVEGRTLCAALSRLIHCPR